MNEHMARLARVQAARDVAAERREEAERQADVEEREAAARVRALQRRQDTGVGEVAVEDVLARIRDSHDRERPEEPLTVVGIPERAAPVDPVASVRARRAARLGRVEDRRQLGEALDRRSKWIATAGDAGFTVPGIYDAWIAENHRRAAGER